MFLLLDMIILQGVLITAAPATRNSMSVVSTCRYGKTWSCEKYGFGRLPAEITEVCDACGNFWGNIIGLTYCCRCNDKVFEFCWHAVRGDIRR